MKKHICVFLSLILVIMTCVISVGAVNLVTTCNATKCSNFLHDLTIGSGSMSVSGTTVTASTSTYGNAISAYAQAGITMANNETYSRWNSGTSYISVSASLPASAPSSFSYGWSDHSSEVYCGGVNPDYAYNQKYKYNYCFNEISASN